MFIGHYGAAFAAKKISVKSNNGSRKPSLGTLFLAAQFLDILWPVFLLLGIEKVIISKTNNAFLSLHFLYYPFSHSLAGTIIWAVLFGLAYYVIRKNIKYSLLMGLLVLSHWILDLIVHVPDLQIIPGLELRLGFGLWNSVPLAVIVESLIFIAGVYLYIKSTSSKNKRGWLTLWGLLIFLTIIYALNLFSPPPPSVNAICFAGLSQWLIIAWGYWIDRNRTDK
jgi:membrane-bound metal-dependent hydrolase YbcI (DUF457 family)